jgi:hypothetical protein
MLIVAHAASPQQAATVPPPSDSAQAGSEGPVRVQTWVTQTAVWPGDRLDYYVQLDLAPRVELPEDMSGEAMAWAPFRLLDFTQVETVRPDGSRAITLQYSLVAVDLTEAGEAQIPPLRVAYVRLPDRPVAQDELAAEELIVEGPRIAFRSTLEVEPELATIRDGQELAGSERSGRTLLALGLGALLLGALPFARSAQAAARGALARRRAARTRGQRSQLRQQVAALRSAPLRGPEDYERLYSTLYAALRDHLADERDVAFPGLTSGDVDALRGAGLEADVVARIGEFLRDCETVRYRGTLPEDAEGRARAAVDLVGGVLAA